ncbi:site-specific integrase [[Clostridium] leptum]|nr:site-specific integrase [[Clostridium] leptum]DAK61272.1 MAG TPA: Integrase [Caudoviricetes sp.]
MARKRNAKRPDGRYAVQVYLGRTEDGRRQYKTVYGQTQKEADEKALEIKIALKKGIDVTAARDTFAGWAQRWLDLKQPSVSHGQYIAYQSCAAHLIDDIGNMPISKIRSADIQEVISSLAMYNPTTGNPSAKKTLIMVRMAASQIFEIAIQNRVIEYNPAKYVKIPDKAPMQTKRALTEEERRWIIETPHRAQPAAMIMMFAGLRRGELIPLTWRDIDLEARTISVNKAVEIINGRPHVKPTAKTDNSIRVIDIPQILVEYLRNLPHDNILVCPSAHGELLSDSAWKSMWNSYLRELNLKYGNFLDRPRSKYDPKGVPFAIPRITAHWLRHTFATILYLSGVDVVTAKEQLGHANIQTTLDIYTHLDSMYKRREMDKLDAYVDASQMQVKTS